ncbi:ACP S-malonyltransferase [Hazenella coriacea]|uniref:Malonyl CoA-acyl carrier protein transacylase n=1 Tax=Hazenella coriacea TaxID=1179467 RepID=A0A4R3L183_9BACL|nr:ACP S-malonyltransferase [Hazenella coriacea]TCS93109.1 [acyl-carrier-protein] S-malonyltransferase [Hazenella coriacea]
MSKLAFIFPGQGSQQVGMGNEIASVYDQAKQIFLEADEVLGDSLSTLCFEGPEEVLRLTANTQPAILTTSVACYRVFAQTGVTPDFVAGHSLGEYSALVAAGSLSFADAVKTVRQRGKFMEDAVPAGVGAMSAVLNLDRERLDEVCRTVSKEGFVVEPANYNCPGQIAISGHKEAVEEAGKKALEAGARRVIPLSVSGPFHSSLMKPAANRLNETLSQVTIHDAKIPVLANVTAQPVTASEEIHRLLVEQVASPVKWEDSVRDMIEQGVTTFVEFGSGTVLSGLVKKVDRKVTTYAVQDSKSLENVLNQLNLTL